ncbi:MAG: LPS export ABC transporter periplasmic protein LptC [Candidatus Binatia bacterium]
MKKRLRFVIMLTVVLLLSAVGLLVGRSVWQQRRQDLTQQGLDFLPGVSQHIRDFHRVKVQNGQKVWEISAQDAQYFQEDNTVVVRNAMMALYRRDGRTIGLKSNEARIILDGREVRRVELGGAIEMTASDYVVRTEQATYDHVRNVISTAGAVEISGRALQLHGDQMEVQVATERVTLVHNVSMRLEPALLPRGEHDAPL